MTDERARGSVGPNLDETQVGAADSGPDDDGPASLTRDLVGQTVDGRYEVLAVIGEGGMGTVFKARHRLLDEVVALKVIRDAFATAPAMRERFLREARANLRLAHPNVIPLRDFGASKEGLLYMTFDLSKGKSLRALLSESRGRLGVKRAIAIARQCLLALEAAHAHGIVHRDLKPDNVLVERGERGEDVARLCDFGIAKLLSSCTLQEASLTGFSVIGTPHYMAPEQASGEGVDARTDLYALGCILYEMLTGARPFEGESASKVLMQHLTEPPEPPSRKAPDVSPALEALVLRALAKDAAERPQSARALLESLDGLESHLRPNRRLRLLLAEDNPVNQRLTSRVLERWGHRVVVASNGLEALARAAEQPFDAVVMDADMPGLDGFGATRALREREAPTGRHTPVIALTAHDRPDDRERCLAGGMDAYVTKPIRAEELFAAIEQATRRSAAARRETPANAAFDAEAAIRRVDGDAELVREVVTIFLAQGPRLMTELRGATSKGDREAVARVAHELKGAAGDCAAVMLHERASRLEAVATSVTAVDLQVQLGAVERAFAEVVPALVAFRERGPIAAS